MAANIAFRIARIWRVLLGMPLAMPVMAQDAIMSQNPVGAAIALSVEPPATGYCRDKDAGRAIACAMEECKADGGLSCAPDMWCAVAGAAGIMFGYNKELGASNLFATCGAFSREGVEAVLKAMCETDARNVECGMVTFWSHDGVREDVQPQ